VVEYRKQKKERVGLANCHIALRLINVPMKVHTTDVLFIIDGNLYINNKKQYNQS